MEKVLKKQGKEVKPKAEAATPAGPTPFNLRVARAVEYSKLSQTDIASRVGCSTDTINKAIKRPAENEGRALHGQGIRA